MNNKEQVSGEMYPDKEFGLNFDAKTIVRLVTHETNISFLFRIARAKEQHSTLMNEQASAILGAHECDTFIRNHSNVRDGYKVAIP